MGKSTEIPATSRYLKKEEKAVKSQKPPFRPAVDDTKPVLQDPILRSDPMETEEAVLRLPTFPVMMRPSES
ncbi:hypothetical protein EUTSA_v10002142mg [Eutrema salsugineum]|uniref:Uncharacterized protein n=1 Tax=Eutrema salsugineum TaxID=72664 RepID=V4M2L1_EUTSA|nr:uncharacterized protein LOC18025430 [Eutrema salsugineum]XP_024016077.1 uncharacterized protein LOC18025430 [Eutrema salsugineum]ESQ50419.1 hypothetical protein EUTSA_v10002142mg [Eutrema salsugineum]